jgi:molybdopterin-synthase adenylyltransferase
MTAPPAARTEQFAPRRTKLGLAARPEVAQRNLTAQGIEYWRLGMQWEPLELADGSIFFDNVYGNHQGLRAAPEVLRLILRTLEKRAASFAELAALGSVDVPTIRRLCEPLIRAGIITPSAEDSAPAWADAKFVERFSTQIDWLHGLTLQQNGHWEMLGRLRSASVAILGLGGAGSMLALMLSAAGVGRLRLVDGDVVTVGNLVRQILYRPDEADTVHKAHSLRRTLTAFTPYTEVEVVDEFADSPDAVRDAVAGVDFVAVCADAPRFLLNRWIDDACQETATPYLGAFVGSVGPMYVPGRSACFGCFEATLRDELGPRHELVVEALAAKRAWRYPSFVSGAMTVAQLMTTEIVLFLSGAAEPATVGGVLRFGHPETTRQAYPQRDGCRCRKAP